jgi:uncharacterized membrane protein YhaH (DUF805 family)
MKGNVIGFDPDTNTGAISGHDGNRYDFATIDWHGPRQARHGDVIDFQPEGRRATQIYLVETPYVSPSFGQFYFSPAGRISRSQYWLRFFLPMAIISFIISVMRAINGEFTSNNGPFTTISFIFQLIVLWPGIAILIKRIHDRNKSGWLVWLLYGPLILAVIFSVFALIALGLGGKEAGSGIAVVAIVFWIITVGVSIWFFIEFGCLRGTIGDNRFGSDPVR